MPADPAFLLRRLGQLQTRRAVVEDVWRDCYRYSYPLLGVGFEHLGMGAGVSPESTGASTARAKTADRLDGTATDAVRVLASALVSGLTPASLRWIEWDAGGEETDEERRWLDMAATVQWENIHASNYDSVAVELMTDLSISGCCVAFCDEAPNGGYKFEQWPLANTWFAASVPGGVVDTVFNEVAFTAEQAAAEYGEHMVSDKIRACLKDKPDETFTFIRAIYPRRDARGNLARNLPVASVHVEKDAKRIVRESGYHELPVAVPRWRTLPGTALAFGPMFEALPDVKTLNEVIKLELGNMDLAVAGMWGAVDDGVLNPRTVTIGARKIIVMAEKDNMWPLQPATDFQVAFLKADMLQAAIRKILMADQLTPPEKGPAMTATEIMVRVELIRQLLGPVYGRLQTEFLRWLANRTFGLALRAGVLGQPPRSLMGKVLSLRYRNPISRAQRQVDVAAMDRFESTLGAEAEIQPGVLDHYDWDEAARERAELLGVPAKLIRDRRVVEQLRAQRAKQAQAQQAMAVAAQAAAQDQVAA